MKYALVLEKCTKTCNDTSTLLAHLGYLITPVFSPKKALHAAHMIQFDLIVTWTASMQGDRRSLTGELARCSPQATLILLADSPAEQAEADADGVSAILCRPLAAHDVQAVMEGGSGGTGMRPPPQRHVEERRRRTVE